jgi:phosphoribosylformylglycinamidine synthase
VNDAAVARVLRAVKFEESGLSPKEIWSNESQELCDGDCTESLAQFEAFCARALPSFGRRRGDRKKSSAALFDNDAPPVHADERAAGQAAQNAPRQPLRRAIIADGPDRRGPAKSCIDVLSHPTVASKRFLSSPSATARWAA